MLFIPLNKFEDYLKNKNLKERSIEDYLYYYNKFKYERFNQESVSRFISKKENRNSVARSFLTNLQKFLKVNRQELKISDDHYEDIIEVELPKLTGRTKVRLVNPIPHNQIPLIEEALPTEKLKLMLLISYYGALRLGELLKLHIMSFNWDEWKKDTSKMGEIRVFGKGDKEGIAILPAEIMVRVARYIRSNEYQRVNSPLFVKDGEKINIKHQSRTWQLKLRKAGIDSGITQLDGNGKPVEGTIIHPHRLRHSFASHMLKDRKKDIRYVQEALRHSSISSTQIYTKIDKDDLKREMST